MGNKKKNKSFTLIEALVVIFVIGLTSSIMIVNWRKKENQYQLQRAAQEIAQTIRKAQDYALNGKQRDWPGVGMIVPDSYGAHFNEDERNYFVYGDRIGNIGYQPPEDLQETNIIIETGIEIESVGTAQGYFDVIFSVPDGFVTFNPSNASGIITVKKTGTTCPSKNCRNIVVKETGEVSIQ